LVNANSPIPGLPPELLLGMVAKRFYAAAVAAGKTKETVPALGLIEPQAKVALERDNESQLRYTKTQTALMYLFDMSRIAADLVLLGLGMELDERLYQAVMKATAAPPGCLGPRVGSLLSLLYPSLAERQTAMNALLHDSSLLRYQLIRLIGDPDGPLSQREFCGEPSLIAHLTGEANPGLPAPLIGLVDLFLPQAPPQAGKDLPADLERMLSLMSLGEASVHRLHIHPMVRRAALPMASRLANSQEWPILMLDLRTVPKSMDTAVALTLRETRLRHGIPLFLNPMSTGDEEPSPLALDRVAQAWRRALATERGLVLFMSDSREAAELSRLERAGMQLMDYKVPRPNFSERQALFEASLKQAFERQSMLGGIASISIAPDVSVRDLASVYRVDEGDINDIVRHGIVLSELGALKSNSPTVLTAQNLWDAGREQTRRDIGRFATLVRSNYAWDDLVLPEEVKEQLWDFYCAARNRAFVHEKWGFGQKHMRGLGLCAIFSGDSGTGKTMAAEVLANMLKVNMYRIDVSMVASKWLGETERNLSEIFSSTESSDAILFFDEAESLFSKRTDSKDARDRYANMETGYMLQRIETYDGIVILSTNLRGNVDNAFLRRMQFGITFEPPEEFMRYELWKKAFPSRTPLDPDVNFGDLAKTYENITGGQIRLIAIGAAMIAASSETPVNMACIHRAFMAEMHKQQKLVSKELESLADRRPRREKTLTGKAPRKAH